MNNEFYVYEWFNKDTGEVFYVGKGKKNRYKTVKNRNQYFTNYYNKHENECDVRKVFKNLTEESAYAKEIELIAKYRKLNMCKCNLDSGGLGGNERIFPSDAYKTLYYDTLRTDKVGFGLNTFELMALCEMVEKRFGMMMYEDIHRTIFKTLSEEEIIKFAEEYCEKAEEMEDEYNYVDDFVKEGAYFSHDDFWEHMYKF